MVIHVHPQELALLSGTCDGHVTYLRIVRLSQRANVPAHAPGEQMHLPPRGVTR